MRKRCLISLAGILVGVPLALGESPESLPAPVHEAAASPISSTWEPPCFGSPESAGCGEYGVFSGEAEYMIWFLVNSRSAFPVGSTDFLDRPDAVIVGTLGDAAHEHKGPISGGRFTVGYWLTEPNPWVAEGIRDLGGEVRALFVGQRSVDFQTDRPATLLRPFFDLNSRTETAFLVAAPGLATGGISAHAQVDLWGIEANVWKNLFTDYPGTGITVDVMAGARYLNLNTGIDFESISVYNQTIPAASPFAPFAGNRLQVIDSFATHNHFYGGQVGIAGKCWVIDNYLSAETAFRLAIGNNSQDVNISGGQLRTFADGSTATYNGGVLALPSNIGSHHSNKFSQVPELEFKVACPIVDHVTLSTGFSAMYWTRVLRAAQQIDRDIDVTQVPNFPLGAGATPTGLAQPGVPFKESDLWVLGISLGVELKW